MPVWDRKAKAWATETKSWYSTELVSPARVEYKYRSKPVATHRLSGPGKVELVKESVAVPVLDRPAAVDTSSLTRAYTVAKAVTKPRLEAAPFTVALPQLDRPASVAKTPATREVTFAKPGKPRLEAAPITVALPTLERPARVAKAPATREVTFAKPGKPRLEAAPITVALPTLVRPARIEKTPESREFRTAVKVGYDTVQLSKASATPRRRRRSGPKRASRGQ